MKQLDIRFRSCNSESYPKPIVATIMRPDQLDGETGLLHFAHGWSGNRFQYRDMQGEFAERYNLVCVATEYRQSGFDFDPVEGRGAERPYDASFRQTLDCLNAVRETLDLFPGVNRERLLLFGGSQGAHVTMLMSIFAPETFALAVAPCGIAYMDAKTIEWSGREFSQDELAVRNVAAMAGRVRCPVVLAHGTADETVPHAHTQELEKALREAGVDVRAKYYEGGSHSLAPVTSRKEAALELADDLLRTARRPGPTDFDTGARVVIPCPNHDCVIDWSRRPDDPELASWA